MKDIVNRGSGALILAILLAGCEMPPAEIIEHGAASQTAIAEQPAGMNQVGEACHYQPSNGVAGDNFAQTFDLYCGSWQQPSGQIYEARRVVEPASLVAAAATSAWRSGLDERITCGEPKSTTVLNGAPAALLECSRRNGGWPHVALTADVGSKTFFVDGVPSALPALETAMAGISGIAVPSTAQRSTAEQLISATIASKPFGSGDRDQYDRLKRLGDNANDSGDYAAAEEAYRAALAVQEQYLDKNNSGLALPIIGLALQISNQNRFGEADQLFQRAKQIVGKDNDPLALATLELYLAEHAANRGQLDEAKQRTDRAELQFLRLVPPLRSLLASGRTGAQRAQNAASGGLAASLFISPEERNAVGGLAATWWFQSYLLYKAGDYPKAETKTAEVLALLQSTGLNPPGIIPRSMEIAALSAGGRGDFTSAESKLDNAAGLFEKYQANERPAAISLFLAGKSAAARGARDAALDYYRKGADLVRTRRIGLPSSLVSLYLAAIEDAKSTNSAKASDLAAESFAAMQLLQSDQTSKVLAEAFARLSSGQSKTQDLLRTMQDDDRELQQLFNQRDGETQKPDAQIDRPAVAKIDAQIDKIQKSRKEAEDAAQAASPEYAQLVQAGASVPNLQKALLPNEGMLAFVVDKSATYAVLVSGQDVHSYRIAAGTDDLAAKVVALRKTIEPDVENGHTELPVYDVAGANALYDLLVAPVSGEIDKLKRLVVVPNGPLTGLPFEVLVTKTTEPVDDQNYANVPFLVQKLAVSYIPSPQNFVVLRKNLKPSEATEPYIGFGDFRPASVSQLTASFPPNLCGQDLAGMEQLPLLPGTQKEISYVGKSLFHVPDNDIVLGNAFTKEHLTAADLTRYRVVHLATHALLPTNLSCLQEPTVIVSADPADKTASSAFLKLSDILTLKMDADLVLLSACNTGAAGQTAGDSLSSLARSFFFTGARGLLVTHWELSDVAAPLLAALTLQPTGTARDSTEALRDAKLTLIRDVSAKLGKDGNFYTHPYTWGAFVLIGDGFRGASPAT